MGRRSSMQTTRGDATLRDALVISLHRESANDRMPWEDCKPAHLASGGLPAEESIAPDPARRHCLARIGVNESGTCYGLLNGHHQRPPESGTVRRYRRDTPGPSFSVNPIGWSDTSTSYKVRYLLPRRSEYVRWTSKASNLGDDFGSPLKASLIVAS